MKIFLRSFVSKLLRMLPAGMPEKIYAMFFRGPLGILANPFIKLLLPKTVQLPEGVVVLNPHDPAVSGALSFGVFEPFESQLFREAVKPGMIVIDIGANIGYYTVIAAGRVGPSGSVIAFEPAPENFDVLRKTVQANNFKNVETCMLAVADKNGMLRLNLNQSNKGRHSLVKDVHDEPSFSRHVEVATVDLDTFLLEKGITQVDIIKMDIEGAESIALNGMLQTIGQTDTIFLEFTPSAIRKVGHDPSEVLQSLRSKGLSLFLINEISSTLVPITDDKKLVTSILGTECVNLICKRENS